ncbi:MAG: hypothetical protein JWP89_4673 [Schlesneria sp.]|nr:hypothetical protein [Schlesneria sp.]
MLTWQKPLAVVVILMVVGCGSAPVKQPEPTNLKSFEELKTRLKEVVQYGQGGSALMGMQESIESLKKVDAAKGDALAVDFKRLDMAATTEERKQIAQGMIDKL